MLAAGNTTICDVLYPHQDIERVLAGSKDGRIRERIGECMHQIRTSCGRVIDHLERGGGG
jgi:hypothetical protein